MGRKSEYARRIDDHRFISVTTLSHKNLLLSEGSKIVQLTWSRKGITDFVAAVLIEINIAPKMTICYTYMGQTYSYVVHFVRIKSNLGAGYFYYFICPHTGLKCRKLYFNYDNGLFGHRTLINGEIYHSQAESKKWKWYERNFGLLYKINAAREEISKKHFKSVYAGKPTKRYRKLYKVIYPTREISTIKMSPEEIVAKMLKG